MCYNTYQAVFDSQHRSCSSVKFNVASCFPNTQSRADELRNKEKFRVPRNARMTLQQLGRNRWQMSHSFQAAIFHYTRRKNLRNVGNP